jgi:hypothetical protein
MSDVGALLDALAGGITAGALSSSPGSSAVAAAYQGLTGRVKGLLRHTSADGTEWFERFETEPRIWRESLAETLLAADIAEDPDVLRMLIHLRHALAAQSAEAIRLPGLDSVDLAKHEARAG